MSDQSSQIHDLEGRTISYIKGDHFDAAQIQPRQINS